MKKTILTLTLGILFLNVFSQLPPEANPKKVYSKTYYTLAYSEEHEQAEWVYYVLTADMLRGTTERTDDFKVDYSIKDQSASLIDYKGSGYDRGHLCPAGDMKINSTAMSESFFMSNMSPQVPSFNRGIWKRLEDNVRAWADKEGSIHVVTGPVFKDRLGFIGPNRVTVPGYYYKAIYDDTGDQKMIALVLPNKKGEKQLYEYAITVDSLEALTGIDFFPGLPDNIENKLESSVSVSSWDFNSVSVSSGGTALQCKGIAKSTGVQCKNKTNNETGYCYLHESQAGSGVKETAEKGASVQCKAIAKSTGNRCKRVTTITNGLCYQHQAYKATNTNSSSSYSTSSGRCAATAKAGSRCKRTAASGSRYCWQHK